MSTPAVDLRLRDRTPPAGCERLLDIEVGGAPVAVLALDSTRLGPAFGGIRRRAYRAWDEARADALRLSRAMTYKCALAGLPAGGGKMVVPWGDDAPGRALGREVVYDAIGRAVARLDGAYVCGPDVGTSAADLDRVRARTRWVNPAENDAGRATAAGVRAGLRAVLRVLHGDPQPAGHAFVVQGLGAVGGALAAGLVREGARVWGADPDPRARARARAAGVDLVEPEAAPRVPCDVWLPCALGDILAGVALEDLGCRAICGSANNQIEDPARARALAARGILHAPDVVVSAGAVIEGVWTVLDPDPARARERIARDLARIEDTTWHVLQAAEGTPQAAAVALARARLSR